MANTDDLRLPVESLAALRAALTREVGPNGVAAALQEAGYAAGSALFERLRARLSAPAGMGGGDDVGHTPEGVFWQRLAGLAREMGWGTLRHESLHQGVGALVTDDWFEARTVQDARRPSCFFTVGLLARLLGQVAGDDVAVLQESCAARGDRHCRFLFGSGETMEALYGGLREGRDLDAALSALD